MEAAKQAKRLDGVRSQINRCENEPQAPQAREDGRRLEPFAVATVLRVSFRCRSAGARMPM